jgi:polar amino acid transport system substrate-binding protein
MKKILALFLVAIMAMGLFASCDMKDTIVVAYTVYKPMNYENDNGEFVGFDTDLAKAVLEDKLGYNIIFKEIDWNQRYLELEAGTIDCIWNGFTANTADPDGVMRSEKVDFSYNYMLNKQVIVTTEAIAATVTGFDSLAGKVGGVEEGSAGDTHLGNLTGSVKKSFGSQLDALRDLVLGTVDFVVLDEQLATAYVGNGDFQNLVIVEALSSDVEYYAIGFKKGSELTAKVNAALEELAAEGKIDEIAQRYNLVTAITDFADQKK